MSEIKCILFDCMETVISIKETPDLRLYAWWAYNNCGHEDLWESFDEFYNEYKNAKNEMDEAVDINEEYEFSDRIRLMVKKKINDEDAIEEIIADIYTNYWNNYVSNCFVSDSTKELLNQLSTKYKCGIVSNFMIDGGIEELLHIFGISEYFDFVVTSINIGWRKPHKLIYDDALKLSKTAIDQILFVGDNYACDYEGPMEYGFKSVLLDKDDKYSDIEQRVLLLEGLEELL